MDTAKIVLDFGEKRFDAELLTNGTVMAIKEALPLTSRISKWGDEIYFETGIDAPCENTTKEVRIGDVAYWPRGRCLCIFYGPTPASIGPVPMPASDVEVIGRINARAEELRVIPEGSVVKVSRPC